MRLSTTRLSRVQISFCVFWRLISFRQKNYAFCRSGFFSFNVLSHSIVSIIGWGKKWLKKRNKTPNILKGRQNDTEFHVGEANSALTMVLNPKWESIFAEALPTAQKKGNNPSFPALLGTDMEEGSPSGCAHCYNQAGTAVPLLMLPKLMASSWSQEMHPHINMIKPTHRSLFFFLLKKHLAKSITSKGLSGVQGWEPLTRLPIKHFSLIVAASSHLLTSPIGGN